MWFPQNSSKAAVELSWLLFTPIWGILAGLIMISGLAEAAMGDRALMLFGVSMAVGTLFVAPYLTLSLIKKKPTNFWPTLASMSVQCVTLAFGMNYFQTPFFFDVLHMRYGFNVSWRIDRNPIFLYFLTIPYFATYTALCCGLYRYTRSKLVSRNTFAFVATNVLVPVVIAFLETFLNANPFTKRIFCYDDDTLALTFGSACYGISFMLSLPIWIHLGGVSEQDDDVKTSLTKSFLSMCAVVLLDWLCLLFIRAFIAPLFTVVADGSGPFGGCLL